MGFVTIKSSHVETELLVLKSRLEAEGIQCFMKNEFSTQIMTHMANFMVELQVLDTDATRAKNIALELEENS